MAFNFERTQAQLFSKRLGRIAIIQNIAKNLDSYDVNKKRSKQNYLYQSYIVYLVAMWQTFLEDLAEESFNKLVERERSSITRGMIRNNFHTTLKKFNTPNTENINTLIEAATGIAKIANNWQWGNMTNSNAKGKLSEILNIRHQIAHTATTDKALTLQGNFEYMEHLVTLATITNEVIVNHINTELSQS